MEEEREGENLIISTAFDKQDFPREYTCDGGDISPAVRIDRIHAPYLAIIVEDITGPDSSYNHWLIWNLPPRQEIPANIPRGPVVTEPIEAVQGTNDFGVIGYTGPCPASGIHQYYFSVYGLDTRLAIPAGSGRKALDAAMKGHMVQYGGQAIATYGR